MEQKTDSLEDWFEKMVKQYGSKKAKQLMARLMVQKSTRHYNAKDRIMPGTVFRYAGRRYVMTGQLTGGKYYRAYGMGDKNFPVRKVTICQQNTGLVYVA